MPTPLTPDKPKKFYVVWCPEHGPFERRHPEFRFAQREASRLAGMHQGKSFYVLSAKSIIVADQDDTYCTFLRRTKPVASAQAPA